MAGANNSAARKGAFTVWELLVVIVIVSVIFIILIPCLSSGRRKSVKGEAMLNIMLIASGLDRRYADGALSYTNGQEACPGNATYSGAGAAIPDLSMMVAGSHFEYTIDATDRDGDGKCEEYLVTATGIDGPCKGVQLSLDNTGKKGSSSGERWSSTSCDTSWTRWLPCR